MDIKDLASILISVFALFFSLFTYYKTSEYQYSEFFYLVFDSRSKLNDLQHELKEASLDNKRDIDYVSTEVKNIIESFQIFDIKRPKKYFDINLKMYNSYEGMDIESVFATDSQSILKYRDKLSNTIDEMQEILKNKK